MLIGCVFKKVMWDNFFNNWLPLIFFIIQDGNHTHKLQPS